MYVNHLKDERWKMIFEVYSLVLPEKNRFFSNISPNIRMRHGDISFKWWHKGRNFEHRVDKWSWQLNWILTAIIFDEFNWHMRICVGNFELIYDWYAFYYFDSKMPYGHMVTCVVHRIEIYFILSIKYESFGAFTFSFIVGFENKWNKKLWRKKWVIILWNFMKFSNDMLINILEKLQVAEFVFNWIPIENLFRS